MKPDVQISSIRWQGLLSLEDLSTVDQMIIAHLQQDGRKSFVSIARDIGATEKTVRSRVRQLLANNTIQIVALTSPDALGYSAGGLVGIRLDAGVRAEDIVRQLVELGDVDYVVTTLGRYAIMAELISQSSQSMHRAIEQGIGSIGGIRSYDVFPYIHIFYQQAQFRTFHGALTIEGGVRPSKIDDTDKAIIVELNRDGRIPMQEIAGKLNVSESLIRNRVKRMLESNAMRIMAITNPMNLSHNVVVWAAVQLVPGHSLKELAEQVSDVPNVTYVAICAGMYDLFVEIVCATNDELLLILDDQVRSLPGTGRVEVFPYLDLRYKRLVPAVE